MKFVNYVQLHFIGFVFSSLFGAVLTVSMFYFTSSPTTSFEIKRKLREVVDERLLEYFPDGNSKVSFDSIVKESLDLSTTKSIFIFGTVVGESNEMARFLAIFEPASQGVFDKLVGRSGFYDLKSFTHIEIPYSNNILPVEINISDIDLDGNKDVFIYVKSVWGDSTSTGVIVLMKNENEEWKFLSIPSLSERLESFTSGNSQHPEGLSPVSNPTIWFGDTKSDELNIPKVIEEYKAFEIYEDEWIARHNGKEKEFVTLRNGGKIKLLEHPFENYKHIGVASYVSDGLAVQGYHHVMVTFLKFENNELIVDTLWNWGYPMLSISQEDLSILDLNVFHSVGMSSHIQGDTFFGYTKSNRINE